jgi:hypothetical protein
LLSKIDSSQNLKFHSTKKPLCRIRNRDSVESEMVPVESEIVTLSNPKWFVSNPDWLAGRFVTKSGLGTNHDGQSPLFSDELLFIPLTLCTIILNEQTDLSEKLLLLL